MTAVDSTTTRGRDPGRAGGETSLSGLLLGGVLKGDVCLLAGCGVRGARVVTSVTESAIGLLAIFGFSDLLIGGGGLNVMDVSLLISPDLRGGGGEGGLDGDNFGDLAESIIGVCGRLGILKFLGELVPVEDGGASVDRKVDEFARLK